MRLLQYVVTALFCVTQVTQLKAQDVAPVIPRTYSNTTNYSYIRTWNATAPVSNPADLTTKGIKEVRQTTLYVDGLGRPLQAVLKKGALATNTNPVDMVSPVVYDYVGREVRKYLPYPSTQQNGTFKGDAFDEQAAFYAKPNGVLKDQGEVFFYSKTDYDYSPLNRITKLYAPGNSWVHDGNGVETKYWINTVTDDVKKWVVNDVPGAAWGDYTIDGYYTEGELFKNVTVDENGYQTIEFKDKAGMIILKKIQLNAPADDGNGAGYNDWICTYYIYDALNLLRAVIQPEAVKYLALHGWDIHALNNVLLNEQCFRYEYDERKRMVRNKVPGAAEVYMIYDIRDRLVFTQDGNLRANNQWMTSLYDHRNRPVMTGLTTYNSTPESLQLEVTQPGSLESIVEGMTINRNPIPSDAGFVMLTQTHYDNYNGIPSIFYTTTLNPSGYGPYLDAAAGDYPESLTIAKSLNDKVTWTKVKVLGENKYIISCSLYDEDGRIIQMQTLNYTSAMDVITNQYSFSGQLLRSHIKHEKGGSNANSVELATKNNYDDLGRLQTVARTLNGGGWKQIATMTYDALGQQITNKLSPAFNNDAGLETLTYDYNIRGWMLGINRIYAKSTSATEHYFGFDLGYDKEAIASLGSYGKAQVNGNIAGTVWKSKGDGQIRKYDFTYDPINRLTKADFNQYNSGFNRNAGIDFSVSDLTYDANGNILTQNQMGLKGISSEAIDQLTYKYHENGYSNRLMNVIDGNNDTQTKLGDFRSSQKYMTELNNVKTPQVEDYNYDVNGNLIFDQNKDIASITYNNLNLPQIITIEGNKGSIEYAYDAAGNKIKKTVHESGKPDKTTLYLFGTYEDDVLQLLPMEEGRIRPLRDGSGAISSFTYDYFLKDHLGNVRVVLTEEQKPNVYQAGMEEALRSYEVQLFGQKVESTLANKPEPVLTEPGFDSDDNNHKVSKLNASSPESRVGPGVILKVMAGDKIKARTFAWYRSYNMDYNTDPGLNAIVENLLGPLVQGVASAAKGALSGQITNQLLQPGMESFLTTQNSSAGAPKAYLNWVLLDDQQFKKVDANCGFAQVPQITATQEKQLLQANNGDEIEITRNGYLYVYVSNESKGDVYFDDIRVEHINGPLLEETHYYPFGLTMAGISSKAMGKMENRRKFNKGSELQNREFSDGSGLEVYDTYYRQLDPQLGRWWQIDPEPKDAESPYVAMGNNPIYYNDPLGNDTLPSGKYIWEAGAVEELKGMVAEDPNVSWSPSFSERLYMIAQWVGLALPSGKLATGAKVEQTTQKAVQAEKVVAPSERVVQASSVPRSESTVKRTTQSAVPKKETVGHGGGKNGQHANPKARAAAEKRYQEAKEAHKELKSKPNKTPEDIAALKKAETRMNHEKKKMDATGENHSQKAKGSN